MSLDFYLSECICADVMKRGKVEIMKKVLKDKIEASAAMRKEAEDRIFQLEPVKERCFISRKHLEYLRECLTN